MIAVALAWRCGMWPGLPPGWPPVVIVLTAACAVAAPVLVGLCWRKPAGLRCVLAVALGLAVVIAARHVTESLVFVPRPFVAGHFRPLFPHSPDSSFPSAQGP